MSQNAMLNLALAAFVGLMALCAFCLDIYTKREASRWFSLPSWIRWSIRITAAIFMVRSVNFITLSQIPTPTVGQANWLAFVASLSMTVTVVSLTVYGASIQLPAKAWDRIRTVMDRMKHHGEVPVMVPPSDVLGALHAIGQPAVDGDAPRDVVHESARAGRMAHPA